MTQSQNQFTEKEEKDWIPVPYKDVLMYKCPVCGALTCFKHDKCPSCGGDRRIENGRVHL